MKKLLGIIVLGLLLSSCSKKDRMEAYSCIDRNNEDATPTFLAIGSDYVIYHYKEKGEIQIPIDEETEDRIFAKDRLGLEVTFYKRTNKYILQYPDPISATFMHKCEKMN